MTTERIRDLLDGPFVEPLFEAAYAWKMVGTFLCDEVERLSQRVDDLEKREVAKP